MLFCEVNVESRASRSYFAVVTIIFLLSYILMASSKWTNNIFYAFIALPGLVMLVRERGAGLFEKPLTWLWLAFLMWFLVPGAVAGEAQFYKHIFYTGAFVFIVAALIEPEFLRSPRFARSMFWILCAYIYGYAIYGYLTGIFAFGTRVGLLPGRLQNVIYASIWLLCALALVLPFWISNRKWIEASSAILLSLVGVAFVLQTRTALVGAAFLFALWAGYAIWRFPKYGLLGLLFGSAVLGLIIWVVSDELWFLSLIYRGDSSRLDLYQIMIEEWLNCGLFLGCGVDFITTRTLAEGVPIQHPHNIFVALGLYTGGVSLVLFLLLMALTLWHAWRERDAWGTFLACALVMLNFDGSKLIGNPDELWPLVLLPAAAILGKVVQKRRVSHY